MKQQCPLPFVWLTWMGLPLLALLLGVTRGWQAAVFVLVVGVAGQLAYVRGFPRISRWLGYGSVADEPAGQVAKDLTRTKVTLYTANVCPFCPIVRKRLLDLREGMGFDLEEIDVTFRPQLVLRKGIRSVPVVEAGGRLLVGNATSAQLAAFLAEAVTR